jgi:class 3 adenylate cyclase
VEALAAPRLAETKGPEFTLFRRLLMICIGCALGAVLVAGLLTNFGLETSRTLKPGPFKAVVYSILVPLLFAVDYLTLRLQYRPIGTFIQRLGEQQANHVLAARALERMLNLPFLTIVRVIAIHGPTALAALTFLLFVIGNNYFDTHFEFQDIVIYWSTLSVIIPAHAILEYFAVQAVVQPVIPTIRSHCDGRQSEKTSSLLSFGIGRKMLLFSVFMTVGPLTVLCFTVLVQIRSLDELLDARARAHLDSIGGWVVALSVFCGVFAFTIAALLTLNVSGLVGRMVRGMHHVEQGKLATRLEVVSTDEFADLYAGFNRMTEGLEERQRLQDAFGRYLSRELADRARRGEMELGGVSVHATVLFADIRGFTNLSEKLKAQEIVTLLNRYFEAMEQAISAQGGWINKFGGDSILAIFGVPVPQTDHAQRATNAALGMRAALAAFNTRQEKMGGPVLRIGVGVHTGWLVAGNVGSSQRMEYTVIGDAVNIAARIQALNKTLGTDLLISHEVCQGIGKDVSVREMPPSEVQGQSLPLRIYALQ